MGNYSVFLTAVVYFATLRLKGRSLPCQVSKREIYIYQGSYTEQVTAGNVMHQQSPPWFALWKPQNLPDTKKLQCTHLPALRSLLLHPPSPSTERTCTDLDSYTGNYSSRGDHPSPLSMVWLTQPVTVPRHQFKCKPKDISTPELPGTGEHAPQAAGRRQLFIKSQAEVLLSGCVEGQGVLVRATSHGASDPVPFPWIWHTAGRVLAAACRHKPYTV